MNTSTLIPTYATNNVYDNKNDLLNTKYNDTELRIELNKFIRQVNSWLMIIEILIVLFGILGNGLALIVINRPSLRNTSSSVFITYLAIFDSLVLFVHLTSLTSFHFMESFILHCLIIFFVDFITFCSVWIMVIMTIERFIAVRSPLLAKRFCTVKRARCSMYFLILFAFMLFSLTFPSIYRVDKKQVKCVINKQYQALIRIIKPLIFYFIPDIILLINFLIIYELFKARRQRTQKLINPENAVNQINAASFNRQEQQLTVMLVAISLSFYLFTTPAVIDYILQRKPPRHQNLKRLKLRFLRSNLTVVWLQMSSATNFLFYYLAGSKFRKTCSQTFDEIYEYIRTIFDENYQRRRNSNITQAMSNICMEMRHETQYDPRNRLRSTSIQQTATYNISNSSKRASNDTLSSIHLINSRNTSKCKLNVSEI